ncbi:MAG: hypothetical protein NTW09_03350 [Candidatus Omnitrophica bacterium]|nr:hypothetical protein [Candidatus Omnitrophota bacterium]
MSGAEDWRDEEIMLLFGVLSIYLAGFVIRRAVFYKDSSILSPAEKVGLDFGFGAGGLALLFFYISFAGAGLTRANMIGLALISIVAAIAIKLHDLYRNRGKRWRAAQKEPVSKTGWMKIVVVIIIGMCVAVIFFKSLYYPMYEWMSRSIFGIKAKVLYESKSIYDKDLLDKEFVVEHPEYPLLIPMLEDWMYTCRNSSDDRFGKGFLPFLAVGFLCSIYAIQRKFCTQLHSLIFTALYATLYTFVYRASCGEADAPLAFYYFLAGSYILLWIRFKIYPYLVSASLFTAIAMFSKLEASGFFAILSGCLAISLFLDKGLGLKKKFTALCAYTIPVFAILIPWMMYKRLLPTTDVIFTAKDIFNPNVFNTIHANSWRVMPIMNNFVFDVVLKTRKWDLFWVLFFVIQAFSLKELFRKPVSYLAFMVWATLGTYLLMFITVYVEPAHMFVTMDRFALQVSGLALLLMSLLARQKI